MRGLIGVLALLGAVPASAQTASTGVVAPAAADRTLGPAWMSAVVSSTGVLTRGSGAASAQRSAMGLYRVLFERSVADCAFTASGNVNPFDGGDVPYVNVYQVPGDPNGVRLVLLEPPAGPVDAPFQLLVFCHK
jgi:hypothetical protein